MLRPSEDVTPAPSSTDPDGWTTVGQAKCGSKVLAATRRTGGRTGAAESKSPTRASARLGGAVLATGKSPIKKVTKSPVRHERAPRRPSQDEQAIHAAVAVGAAGSAVATTPAADTLANAATAMETGGEAEADPSGGGGSSSNPFAAAGGLWESLPLTRSRSSSARLSDVRLVAGGMPLTRSKSERGRLLALAHDVANAGALDCDGALTTTLSSLSAEALPPTVPLTRSAYSELALRVGDEMHI